MDVIVGTGVLLRFGHARALTTIQVVIHSPYAASLPLLSDQNEIFVQNYVVEYMKFYIFAIQIFHIFTDSRGRLSLQPNLYFIDRQNLVLESILYITLS